MYWEGNTKRSFTIKTESKILRAGKLSPLFHEVIVTTLIRHRFKNLGARWKIWILSFHWYPRCLRRSSILASGTKLGIFPKKIQNAEKLYFSTSTENLSKHIMKCKMLSFFICQDRIRYFHVTTCKWYKNQNFNKRQSQNISIHFRVIQTWEQVILILDTALDRTCFRVPGIERYERGFNALASIWHIDHCL